MGVSRVSPMDSRTGRSCLAMVTRRVCEALTIPVLSPLAHAAGCDFAVPPNKVISNLLALGLQALIHLLVSKIGQNPQQFIGCNVTTAALDFVGIDGLCELLALGREVVIRVAELPTFASSLRTEDLLPAINEGQFLRLNGWEDRWAKTHLAAVPDW